MSRAHRGVGSLLKESADMRAQNESRTTVLYPPIVVPLEIAVIEGGNVHALAFPVVLQDGEWRDASFGRRVQVQPTHWRHWGLLGTWSTVDAAAARQRMWTSIH